MGKITLPDADDDNEVANVQTARPLRILDRSFENTACMVSSITVMYICHTPLFSRILSANTLLKGMETAAKVDFGTSHRGLVPDVCV